VEKAGGQHIVKVGGVVRDVSKNDIFKCGERMGEPCRDTQSVKLKFVPFRLKNTISKWKTVLTGWIVDFGELYSQKESM